MFQLVADGILLLHVLFVLFVVVGLLLIVVGKLIGWSWIRNPWFRALHLIAIGVVVIQSWLDVVCPLTTLEMVLRERAGQEVYSESFIAHWLGELLYYQAPPWVFVLAYSTFGALVVLSWFWARPRSFSRGG